MNPIGYARQSSYMIHDILYNNTTDWGIYACLDRDAAYEIWLLDSLCVETDYCGEKMNVLQNHDFKQNTYRWLCKFTKLLIPYSIIKLGSRVDEMLLCTMNYSGQTKAKFVYMSIWYIIK